MTELLLVRHGESTWNAAGRLQGQTAWPALTDRGRRQAAAVAARLLAHNPRRLVTSDLVRATQSAEIIGQVLGLDLEANALLRERHYGVWQRTDVAEAARLARSLADHQRIPGGESLSDVRHRWRTLTAELRGSRGPVVLVTHGNIIAEAVGRPIPANGSVSKIRLV